MTDPDVELQPAVIEDSDDDFQYEEVEVVRYRLYCGCSPSITCLS